ncbi:MAG: hypothetical protein AABZ23_02010 [Deltaproteobacteria bacterium]
MAGDFTKPTLSTAYSQFLTELSDLIKDGAKMFDGTNTLNPPSGAIRWNSSTSLWEKYNGASWLGMATLYNIDVDKVDACDAGTAPNNVLKLDGSGKVPWNNLPANPSFHVHKNGTNQSISTGGSGTLLTWSTAEFDTHSGFSSTKYTPSIAGKYLFTATATILSPASTLISIALYKNGLLYKNARYDGAGTTNKSLTVTCVATANGTTDYFEIYFYQESGSAKNVSGAIAETYFSGCKIG